MNHLNPISIKQENRANSANLSRIAFGFSLYAGFYLGRKVSQRIIHKTQHIDNDSLQNSRIKEGAIYRTFNSLCPKNSERRRIITVAIPDNLLPCLQLSIYTIYYLGLEHLLDKHEDPGMVKRLLATAIQTIAMTIVVDSSRKFFACVLPVTIDKLICPTDFLNQL